MFRVTIYENFMSESLRDTIYLEDFDSVVKYLDFRSTCVGQSIVDVFITDVGKLQVGDD